MPIIPASIRPRLEEGRLESLRTAWATWGDLVSNQKESYGEVNNQHNSTIPLKIKCETESSSIITPRM